MTTTVSTPSVIDTRTDDFRAVLSNFKLFKDEEGSHWTWHLTYQSWHFHAGRSSTWKSPAYRWCHNLFPANPEISRAIVRFLTGIDCNAVVPKPLQLYVILGLLLGLCSYALTWRDLFSQWLHSHWSCLNHLRCNLLKNQQGPASYKYQNSSHA